MSRFYGIINTIRGGDDVLSNIHIYILGILTRKVMANVKFDKDTHTYTIADEEYPSVTEICEPISFKKLDALSKQILDNAARRGAKVH